MWVLGRQAAKHAPEAGVARRLWNECFFSAPQPRRTPLGSAHLPSLDHRLMLSLLATVCAGLFSGAAVYVNLVEHPARLSCGTDLAVKEFGPSYRRGTMMQASLALAGCALGVAAWARGGDRPVPIAAVLLGAVVP